MSLVVTERVTRTHSSKKLKIEAVTRGSLLPIPSWIDGACSHPGIHACSRWKRKNDAMVVGERTETALKPRRLISFSAEPIAELNSSGRRACSTSIDPGSLSLSLSSARRLTRANER